LPEIGANIPSLIGDAGKNPEKRVRLEVRPCRFDVKRGGGRGREKSKCKKSRGEKQQGTLKGREEGIFRRGLDRPLVEPRSHLRGGEGF